MTPIKNIYTKLLNIQSKIKGLKKDKKSHGFDYVSGNKLLSFIRPLMDENKLLLKQEIISIDNERQDYHVKANRWVKNSNGENIKEEFQRPKSEMLSKVMMRFTWIDAETGEKDINLFGANGQNGWDKGVGSALTYGERYFILKYFHIPTDEDDIDNPNLKPKDEELAEPKKPVDENRRPSITTSQFEIAKKSDVKGIKAVLNNCRMSSIQRELLISLTKKT